MNPAKSGPSLVEHSIVVIRLHLGPFFTSVVVVPIWDGCNTSCQKGAQRDRREPNLAFLFKNAVGAASRRDSRREGRGRLQQAIGVRVHHL